MQCFQNRHNLALRLFLRTPCTFGMGPDQLKELKKLKKENEQLRRAVADLTLDKQILAEAARGNF